MRTSSAEPRAVYLHKAVTSSFYALLEDDNLSARLQKICDGLGLLRSMQEVGVLPLGLETMLFSQRFNDYVDSYGNDYGTHVQRMVPVRHRDGMLHCPYSIVCHLLNAFGTMSPALSVANGCDLVEDIYRLERLVVATLGHLLHIEVRLFDEYQKGRSPALVLHYCIEFVAGDVLSNDFNCGLPAKATVEMYAPIISKISTPSAEDCTDWLESMKTLNRDISSASFRTARDARAFFNNINTRLIWYIKSIQEVIRTVESGSSRYLLAIEAKNTEITRTFNVYLSDLMEDLHIPKCSVLRAVGAHLNRNVKLDGLLVPVCEISFDKMAHAEAIRKDLNGHLLRSDVTATFRGVVVQNGSDDECKMLVTTLGERNALQEIKKIFSSTFAEHPGVVKVTMTERFVAPLMSLEHTGHDTEPSRHGCISNVDIRSGISGSNMHDFGPIQLRQMRVVLIRVRNDAKKPEQCSHCLKHLL